MTSPRQKFFTTVEQSDVKNLVDSLNGKSATNHTHPIPRVLYPPVTLSYSSSLTPDASQGNYRICTLTGDTTLNEPTSPIDGQMIRIRFLASGAQRTVTFATAFERSTGVETSLVIPSGKRGDVGMIYESADGWTIQAATAQQVVV